MQIHNKHTCIGAACDNDCWCRCHLEDQVKSHFDYDQLILDTGQIPTGYLGELD